ncbi:aryl-alcohol dehydrogenase-like predicted oxidoreductase [Sphingobacterium alimentarium]|uniref:Aryl-alcohol dehydrogenase-like predicted oxidoreductase n=1 Tax=Sphingobacterium alimentarium TaxID=797292 RepID=A0A4R3VKH8_9SPHI|nr:aldo/keto reductase [Sphingobacterium alimentarium]TCV04992.1 aryl-alcohol dehydrogenase-like predicted oxidoreductase [Sphingobacterium alimentarium]
MQYNTLGNSSIKISSVGIGCMSMSPSTNMDYVALINQAVDNGINYFDTADLYDFGENERLLGKAVKGIRQQLVIATKVGNEWNKDRSGWKWNVSKDYINKAIDDSLTRLGTDYIDLYQIHGGTKEDNLDEVVDTLEKLKQSGKIKEYGISSIRPNVFLPFAAQSNMVSNMMQFSLLDTRPEAYVGELREQGISILVRGAFAQGLLLNKPAKDYLQHSPVQVEKIANWVSVVAKQEGISKETVALAYLLQRQQVTAAVIGIRTAEHLENLLQATQELTSFNMGNYYLPMQALSYQDHIN